MRNFLGLGAKRSREIPSLEVPLSDNSGPVISLTSFPPRMPTLGETLRSLASQTAAVQNIFLALSRDEFPNGLRSLPPSILEITNALSPVLTVRFCERNTRSYKKLLPALTEFGARQTIITVDDDVIYPRDFVSNLLDAARHFPDSSVGTRGVTISTLPGGGLAPYLTWKQAPLRSPSMGVFLTGRGGILYPPGSLEGFQDRPEFMQLAPSSDDVWFKFATVQNGFSSVRVGDGLELPSSSASQKVGLYRRNNSKFSRTTPNDMAIAAVSQATGVDLSRLLGEAK
ncbi:hypothetical protein QE430_002577 [Microbacterium testaceum]|uniref:hypothetical protein n=1 Tax=Microbacterium testaceum TaxID=2033 RepID=UPI002786C072|nr:hypothetical protein [Microbacterium testaceum]MDQ1174270.1 hypothetical protein [Microbacterium testaceum]